MAERIRSRTETTLISLSPGVTDRISVSIGIASAPQQAHDRITPLRLADQALYRAKEAGRNRVVYEGGGLGISYPDANPIADTAPSAANPVERRDRRRAPARKAS